MRPLLDTHVVLWWLDDVGAAGALPRRHDDPFDRMLLAQGAAERLTLVTADRRLGDYGVAVLAAA